MLFTYREQGRSFQELGLWQGGSATVTGLSEPEQVRSLRMTHGTLDALAVPPAIGRWFTLQDDTPGTPETIILMHGYWERRFGADASVIGRTLNIDSTPRVVIGVMPAGFRFIDTDADMILPLRFDRSRVVLGNFSYQGVARLQPGATVEQANADVGRLLPIWLKGWPAPFGLDAKIFENARLAPALRPLKQKMWWARSMTRCG
jgi:putative ABC transport system permease protein